MQEFAILLRSSSQSLLQVPRVKTDFGRRAFSSAAETWNHIPAAIKVSPSLDSFSSNVTLKHTILPPHNFLTTAPLI